MAPKPPPAKDPDPKTAPPRTVERTKRDPLRYAVAQIRRYMISLNPDFYYLNDTEIILAAENASRELLPWAEKIKEIQAEIADLHYKLNHDWITYKGFLYLPSYEINDYSSSIEMCKRYKAYLTDILEDDEEAFLEELIKKKHSDYWIGLVFLQGEWRWHDSRAKSLKNYWLPGEPNWAYLCGRMSVGCTTKLQCWLTMDCKHKGRAICKQKPEDKWIN